jgi:hypothetical protein
MKNLHTFEEFLNENKSVPSHIEKAIKDLAYSMPNHTVSDKDGNFTDEQILKAIKKYNPALQQALKNGLEKEILDGVKAIANEN